MSLWGCEELYVTGLASEVTEPELRGLFSAHGVVKEAVIVNKKGPSAPGAPQSCIVRMGAHLDAVKAKKALHKYDWMGKQISVKWSHNQRVVWVSNLHDSVTNEVLHAAFSQFGAVSKAIVACDAPNNSSKGWGFVSFENKRFAVKAIESCRERPFLVGAGAKPVIVDWARNEEVIEGYSEEVRSGNKAAAQAAQPPENAGRVPLHNTKEGMQAGNLLALRHEYEDLKRILKLRLLDAENQVVFTGSAPRLSHMLLSDPHLAPPNFMMPPPGVMGGPMRPPMAPPPPPPPPGGSMGAAPMGGPFGYPHMGPPGSSGPMKRDAESFHQVPPPNKRAMQSHPNDRFNPNPNFIKLEPQQAPAQPPPPQRPSSAFVRGGELHTVGQQGRGEHGHIEGGTAPPAVGSKQPGSHDHGGIGFSSPAPGPAGGAGQGKSPGVTGNAAGTPGTYSYDNAASGRAPYNTYQYPYNAAQQAPNAAPTAQSMGAYGSTMTQQQNQQPQQQQYGGYVPPPGSANGQPLMAQQQPAAYSQPAANAYAPPPDQQQPQQQQYNYGAYGNYYQQASGAPPQQPAQQAGQTASYQTATAAGVAAPGGAAGQSAMQQPYVMQQPQQQMYGGAMQQQMPGQSYFG